MESLLEPVELNRETAQALDEIRSGAANALYGAASADAEEKVNNSVLPLIEGAGLPGLHVMHYRWYLRELARHWRTRRGRDLAFHLELCIRKWVGLGLEPRTLQFLICEAHQRLKGKSGTSRPPITPITEDSSSSARDPNLRESVESVDSAPAPSSAESARSADVRAESAPTPTPDPQPLTPDIETAKDAKIAKSGHSISRSLDPSIPCSSHSIPRSLDPSIPEVLS